MPKGKFPGGGRRETRRKKRTTKVRFCEALAPDLELYRDDNIVTMENADSIKGPLTGFIRYQSGNYIYTLHSPRNAYGVAGTEDVLYRLTASQVGQEGYVFDKTCLPNAVHDFTFLWIAG
jgi:hypothetical protein